MASSESFLTNTRHGVRNVDGGKAEAIDECLITNTRYGVVLSIIRNSFRDYYRTGIRIIYIVHYLGCIFIHIVGNAIHRYIILRLSADGYCQCYEE